MELALDKATKILLGAIALGLFLNASNVFIGKAYANNYDVSEQGDSGYETEALELEAKEADGESEDDYLEFDEEFTSNGEGYDENSHGHAHDH